MWHGLFCNDFQILRFFPEKLKNNFFWSNLSNPSHFAKTKSLEMFFELCCFSILS